MDKLPAFNDDSESHPSRSNYCDDEVPGRKSSKHRSKIRHSKWKIEDVKRRSSSKLSWGKYDIRSETEPANDDQSGQKDISITVEHETSEEQWIFGLHP